MIYGYNDGPFEEMNIFFTNHTTILKMSIRFQEMSAMDFVLKNVKVLNLYYFVPLREKCRNTELFLVHIFLYSDWIRRFTPKISVFSSNTGKYGPEITPYLDTFHAMLILKLLQRISVELPLILRWGTLQLQSTAFSAQLLLQSSPPHTFVGTLDLP